MFNEYIVKIADSEVCVQSENSKNALYCAFVKMRLPMSKVKIVRRNTKGSLEVLVKEVKTNKVESYRIKVEI